MPAFTTPAALRRLSRTGSLRAPTSPSSPTTASQAPSTQPLATPPTSTASPGTDPSPSPRPSSPLAPLENESIVLRAARAYERDRQRAKKTKERSERERHKLQKQQQRASAGGGAGPGPDGRAPRQHQHQHAREGSVRKVIGVPGSGVNGADAVLAPAVGSLCVGVEEIIADVVERESRARGDVSPERPLEVPIEELMKPGKTRRSKAGEFEMIPGMPVVIALDEHLAEDAELDEPWEHISADELNEKRVAPPSYATVVATTA
ncbi:hypothetical protein C8Q73DRAFT_717934 [Cubamyces lactineus]|nr:hypothetical protein C8Q73DRAFT_717934 [Cubamyces lactineus]